LELSPTAKSSSISATNPRRPSPASEFDDIDDLQVGDEVEVSPLAASK